MSTKFSAANVPQALPLVNFISGVMCNYRSKWILNGLLSRTAQGQTHAQGEIFSAFNIFIHSMYAYQTLNRFCSPYLWI